MAEKKKRISKHCVLCRGEKREIQKLKKRGQKIVTERRRESRNKQRERKSSEQLSAMEI